VGWGHSTVDQALRFAGAAGVRRMVTFHHDPGHTDPMLDQMLQAALDAFDPPFAVEAGMEGARFEV
jgi:phosphoribosyl 1,2-cyclic phosphodiesterase